MMTKNVNIDIINSIIPQQNLSEQLSITRSSRTTQPVSERETGSDRPYDDIDTPTRGLRPPALYRPTQLTRQSDCKTFCSQRYRVTAVPSVCSTDHTCGPTLQTDHIRPSSIFCCGSYSVEQSSCRIQRPDNQRCLLPTAFKDSSVRTTASAPQCLARAGFYMITHSINSHYITLHSDQTTGILLLVLLPPALSAGGRF